MSGRSRCGALSALDTVCTDTSAWAATCFNVATATSHGGLNVKNTRSLPRDPVVSTAQSVGGPCLTIAAVSSGGSGGIHRPHQVAPAAAKAAGSPPLTFTSNQPAAVPAVA